MGLQSWDTGLWQVLVLYMFVCSLKTPKLQARHKKECHAKFFFSLPCHVSSLSPACRGVPLCCRWASARSGTQGLGKERSTWWNLLHLLNKCNLNLVMHFTILILKRNLETISFPISLARTPVYGRQNLSLEPASPLCELVSCEHNTEPMEEHRSSD